MGFDAEIDNSERNSVVENLKDEVKCSICCSIFEVLFLTVLPINCLLEFRYKWLSEAKLKARSEASRQNISNFHF